jgi:hypothetical protein
MPARSAIIQLPGTVKTELDRRLHQGGFSGYEQLAEWLSDQGYPIGKSSIHRYGQNLERRLSAIKASTEAAAIIAEAAPDDADLRSAAVISLVQTELFETILNLQEASADDISPQVRVGLLSAAAKNIATLTRASVNQKKWQLSVRDKVSAAADAVEAVAKKGGLSKEALDTIRRDILGIAA